MKVESKASAAAWGTIRDSILVAVTENSATPVVVQCLSCKCTASYRCEQCGPFYCEECIKKESQHHESLPCFGKVEGS